MLSSISSARKEDLNRIKLDKRTKEYHQKMADKVASWIGIMIAIIVGWDKISKFIQSFFEGITEILKSIPPLILLGIVIFIIYQLGHKK